FEIGRVSRVFRHFARDLVAAVEAGVEPWRERRQLDIGITQPFGQPLAPGVAPHTETRILELGGGYFARQRLAPALARGFAPLEPGAALFPDATGIDRQPRQPRRGVVGAEAE